MAGWGKIRSCLIVGWVLTGIGLGTPSSDRRPLAGQPIALVGGMLIDGYGGPPLPDAVVLIEGNEIRAVGPVGSVSIPPDAYVIDTEGRTVLPGLMDMHVHLDILGHADYAYWFTKYRGRWLDLIMPIAARQLLMAGVTTVRDVGAELDSILEFKRRVERGQVPGPRLFVSGPFLQVAETISDYEKDFRWPVRDVTDARAKVRKLVEAGVDLIKLIDQDRMPQEVVNAIVDEAHRHGRHVRRLMPTGRVRFCKASRRAWTASSTRGWRRSPGIRTRSFAGLNSEMPASIGSRPWRAFTCMP
jgi:hypothetical protein